MKILLLEDEVMLNESIEEFLTSEGHSVDSYFDGVKAFDALKLNSYDLLILDINVPGMDGLTFLEKLHELKIHCGSRGFGHQVCTDYVREFQAAVRKYGIDLPDRELVCAPMDSPEGQAYLGAMRAAANFAFANRQLLAYSARKAFEETFAGKTKDWHLHQVYDIAHNMGKIETHEVDGKQMKVCVHRKGATRAFGPGAPGLPPEYKAIGQPVIIPGSMGLLGAGWHAGEHGTLVRVILSWGGKSHVPQQGQENGAGG